MENEAREKIVCLHLNPQLEILSYEVVAIGTDHYVICEPTEVFRSAIVVRASRIVVIHNHPLGSHEPSPKDVAGARKMREIGEMMKIKLLDFIIIGEDGYTSLEDNGVFD